MKTKLLLKSSYIPKRKTDNLEDWKQYIDAKMREIRFGTHQRIGEKS